uniref:uncharacterized protein LOC120332945 n=1 Tax=Styela clava TaxID=7725 RepID=UPI001939EB91|nr:uncharacterized protein LOC120332945 [Styela clava]
MKTFSHTIILWFVAIACVPHVTADGDEDDDECELPPAQQNIDWSKMTGVWYGILNVRTPSDRVVPCYQIQDIRPISNGITSIFKDVDRNTNVTIDAIKQNSGGFIWNQEHVEKWMKYLRNEVKPSVAPSQELLEESMELSTDEYRYFTDYDNYTMYLVCTKKGKKMFWISSRMKRPDARAILEIFNQLIKLKNGWNEVPLYFSGCVDNKN